MRVIGGLLFALVLMTGATPAEANYTIAGEFTGTADYFSGARDFFLNPSPLDVDKVVGSITLNAMTAQFAGSDVVGYSGTADYSLSLIGLGGQLLYKYSGTGSDAYYSVDNGTGSTTATSGFGISSANIGTSFGKNFQPFWFSVSDFTTVPNRFELAFKSLDGKTGSIQGSFLTTSVTVTPALPTPVPAALPLFASGLAGLGFLRRRSGFTW